MQLIGVNLGAAIQGNANIIEVLEEFGREFKTIVAKAFGKNLPVAESFFGHIACVGRSLAVCPDLKCPNAQSFPQFFQNFLFPGLLGRVIWVLFPAVPLFEVTLRGGF